MYFYDLGTAKFLEGNNKIEHVGRNTNIKIKSGNIWH